MYKTNLNSLFFIFLFFSLSTAAQKSGNAIIERNTELNDWIDSKFAEGMDAYNRRCCIKIYLENQLLINLNLNLN